MSRKFRKQRRIKTFETEDHLLIAGVRDDGVALESTQCKRLFDLSGAVLESVLPTAQTEMEEQMNLKQVAIMQKISATNGKWFDAEIEKLDRWADDHRKSMKVALDELEENIRAGKREARLAPNLPEKLQIQQRVRQLESRHTEALLAYKEACRTIDAKKDTLLDETSNRLQQQAERQDLFLLRWRLV